MRARGYHTGAEAQLAVDFKGEGEQQEGKLTQQDEVLIICEVTGPALTPALALALPSPTTGEKAEKPKSKKTGTRDPEHIAKMNAGRARWQAERQAAAAAAKEKDGEKEKGEELETTSGLTIQAQVVGGEKPEELHLQEVVATAGGPFHSGN